MTLEQLLAPRYKVITDYPGSEYTEGEVIQLFYAHGKKTYYSTSEDGGMLEWESFYKAYPEIFRPMKWHEERKPEDMPEYVKWEYDTDDVGKIEKVTRWWLLHDDLMADVPSVLNSVLAECLLPATEEEYNNYINSNP